MKIVPVGLKCSCSSSSCTDITQAEQAELAQGPWSLLRRRVHL